MRACLRVAVGSAAVSRTWPSREWYRDFARAYRTLGASRTCWQSLRPFRLLPSRSAALLAYPMRECPFSAEERRQVGATFYRSCWRWI